MFIEQFQRIISSGVESTEHIGFDFGGSTVRVDKYSNVKKCSEKYIFTDKIEPISSNGVETIGGKDVITKEIFTIRWSWTDEEVQIYTSKFKNILYSTDSPVNILCTPVLAESMKDDEVTRFPTKGKCSIFTLDFGKYKNKIDNPEHFLPELEIQYGFCKFSGVFKIMVSISVYCTSKFNFT